MDFNEFVSTLRRYENMTYDETVDKETFTVKIKCGDNVVINHTVIKCECETADDVRQFVYERVLDAMYGMGIQQIFEKCGGPQSGPDDAMK